MLIGLMWLLAVWLTRSSPRILPRGESRYVQSIPSTPGGSPDWPGRGGGYPEGTAPAVPRAESRRRDDLPGEHAPGKLLGRGAGLSDFHTEGLGGFPSRGRSPIGPCPRGQALFACVAGRGLIASGAWREASSPSARRRLCSDWLAAGRSRQGRRRRRSRLSSYGRRRRSPGAGSEILPAGGCSSGPTSSVARFAAG